MRKNKARFSSKQCPHISESLNSHQVIQCIVLSWMLILDRDSCLYRLYQSRLSYLQYHHRLCCSNLSFLVPIQDTWKCLKIIWLPEFSSPLPQCCQYPSWHDHRGCNYIHGYWAIDSLWKCSRQLLGKNTNILAQYYNLLQLLCSCSR